MAISTLITPAAKSLTKAIAIIDFLFFNYPQIGFDRRFKNIRKNIQRFERSKAGPTGTVPNFVICVVKSIGNCP